MNVVIDTKDEARISELRRTLENIQRMSGDLAREENLPALLPASAVDTKAVLKTEMASPKRPIAILAIVVVALVGAAYLWANSQFPPGRPKVIRASGEIETSRLVTTTRSPAAKAGEAFRKEPVANDRVSASTVVSTEENAAEPGGEEGQSRKVAKTPREQPAKVLNVAPAMTQPPQSRPSVDKSPASTFSPMVAAIPPGNSFPTESEPNERNFARPSRPVAEVLLSEARTLLVARKVIEARAKLTQGEPMRNASVAWALARTYDPNVLREIDVDETRADVGLAVKWYRQWHLLARKEGLVSETSQIDRLIDALR